MIFKVCHSQNEIFEAIRLRQIIFHQEMGVDYNYIIDNYDDYAIHYLIEDHGKAIGTARAIIGDNSAQLGRICIVNSARKKNIGTFLLKNIESDLKNKGVSHLFLESQMPVVPFYKKCGYDLVGTVFEKASIIHIRMEKTI